MEGIKIEFFDIILNKFDGFGFSLLNFSFNIKKVITISKGGSLLHLSVRKHYDYGGIEWKFHLNILGFALHKTIKTIKPKRNYCMECGYYFDSEPYIGKNNQHYCSVVCVEGN